MLTETDLQFIIRDTGTISAAIACCDRVASRNGPLSHAYADAAQRLRARSR